MKNYKNKDYLESLLKDPDELKKQILFSYGGILHKMFTQNIVPPLSLLSSKEHQTGIGTIMVQLYSQHYKDADVKSFVEKVIKDQNEKENKIEFGSHFLNSVKPQIAQYLPKQNELKETLKIETAKDYFEALNIYEKAENNEQKQIVEGKIKSLDIEDILLFKDIADEDTLDLLEKSVPFLESLYNKSHYSYESIGITEVIYSILKANDFLNIPENVIPLIPLSLLFKQMEKNEDNISFMRHIVEQKIIKDPKLLLVGLNKDDIHYFEMFNLDYNNDMDKKIIMKIIDFHYNNTYSHKEFRKFVLTSPIAKLVPIQDLTSVFYKANKLGVEFGKEIFGDESIDTIVKITSLKRTKCLTIDDLIDFFNDGRSYSDKFLNNIQIPQSFLERLEAKLKDAQCSFIYSDLEYYRDNAVNSDKVNVYIQCLSYFTKEKIQEIKLSGTNDSELDKNVNILKFLTVNFSNLTGRDSYFDRSHKDDDAKTKMIEAIKLENLIYDFSKDVFKKSQTIFKYDDIEFFREMYNDTTSELSYGLVSSMVQNIKKPSMMWALYNIDTNNYSNSYTHVNVNALKDWGISYEETIKSYLECPSVDVQNVINKLPSLDDYEGQRSMILNKVGRGSPHIYIGLVNQMIDKQRFPEMNDVEFYQHLNAVKDYLNKRESGYGEYYSIFINKINDSQNLLNIGNLDKNSLPEDYIYNFNYLHENFSLDLLYKYISEEKDALNKWYDLKGKDISKDIINSIIFEVFNKFHDTNGKGTSIIETSKDFIFKFVKDNPLDYENVKDKLLTGPHANLYDGMFVKTDRDVVKEMIKIHSVDELNKLYDLLTLDDISKNMEKILESENLELITVLKEKLPGDNFIKIFNECKYQYQRLLLDNPILENTFTDSFGKKSILFNPSTFDEFVEIFEKLRLKKRVELSTTKRYKSDDELNYYDMKRNWEFSKVLRYISLPNLDSVVNYVIDELPLSFTSCYELNADKIYGRLPRTLNSQEFLKLLKNIKSNSPGAMYLGHQVNDENKIYECLFASDSGYNKKDSDKYHKLNSDFDNYLRVLDCLKSEPKEYTQMFALTQNFIYVLVGNLLDQNNNVYAWNDVPEDCLLLKELQNIFKSKYQWPEEITQRNSSLIYREEYIHKFFNIFIDKKIYLEGFKELKEENLLNPGFSEKIYKNFYSRFLYPFYYEVKLSGYTSTYTTDYNSEELNKISKDLLEVDSTLFLDYNYPKTRAIKYDESQKLKQNSGKDESDFTEDERKMIAKNALIKIIDEDINNDNIWPIILATQYNVHMNGLEDKEKKEVFEEILGKPDLDLEMISSLSKALDVHDYLSEREHNVINSMDKDMLYNLRRGIFSYTESTDRKNIKITLEQLYMEQQSSPKTIEPLKKTKKF